MLDNELKNQLRGYLVHLTRPVVINAFTDQSEKSSEMMELLEDICAQSEMVQLIVSQDLEARKPSFSLSTPGQDISISFAGIPLGHEFTSLILALLQVGGHPSKEAEDLLNRVRNIKGEFLFETYYSLSCQNCPEVVQALNLAATINPNIRHVAIDGALFQDEVEARQIMSVPAIFLNGELFGQGRMNLSQVVAQLDEGGQENVVKEMSAKPPFDVLIIGGGPAGASSAIYAARKGVRTGVLSQRFGGQVLDTMSIENFISVPSTDGPKLTQALEQHVRQYDVDVMDGHSVESLYPDVEDGLIEVKTNSGATLKSQSIILSTGARWRQLGVPGEQEYQNKGVAYCTHCDGPLFKGKRVAVIGGGNSGVEAAIDLAGIVKHVTVIEFDEKLRADDVLQRKLATLDNVEVIVSAQTTEVMGDGTRVSGLAYIDRRTEESHQVDLDGVFVQIGLLPNTDWIKGVIDMNDHGEIIVDDRGRTNISGIFAAGDCTTAPYKQIVVAMGQGATAALSAFDFLIRKEGTPRI